MLNELREAQAKFENREIGKKELEEVINRMKICVSSVDDAIHQLRSLLNRRTKRDKGVRKIPQPSNLQKQE